MKYLISQGVDPAAHSQSGRTAADEAERANRLDIVSLIDICTEQCRKQQLTSFLLGLRTSQVQQSAQSQSAGPSRASQLSDRQDSVPRTAERLWSSNTGTTTSDSDSNRSNRSNSSSINRSNSSSSVERFAENSLFDPQLLRVIAAFL